MAAGRLLIPGWMPALDEDGNPIPNARVFFYLNKTTTLAAVFSDEAMTVPLVNPVPSNASGRFPAVWADDSVLYSASVDAPYGPAGIPFTYDDLSASMAADILVAGAAEAAADEAQQTLVEIQEIIDAAMQAGGGEAAVAGAIAGTAAAQAVVENKADTDGGNVNDVSFRAVLDVSRNGSQLASFAQQYTTPSRPSAVSRPFLNRLVETRYLTDFVDPAQWAAARSGSPTGTATNGLGVDAFSAAMEDISGSVRGRIIIPEGVWRLPQMVINKGVEIIGEGSGSIIQTTSATQDQIIVNTARTSIHDIAFQSTVARTAGSCVVNNNAAYFEMSGIQAYNPFTVFQLNGHPTVPADDAPDFNIDRVRAYDTVANGIPLVIAGGYFIRVSDFIAQGDASVSALGQAAAGVLVTRAADLCIDGNSQFINCQRSMDVRPPAGSTVASFRMNGGFCGTSYYGSRMTCEDGGNIVSSQLNNVWFGENLNAGGGATGSGNALSLIGSAAGRFQGISINGCEFPLAQFNGLDADANVEGLQVAGGWADGCGGSGYSFNGTKGFSLSGVRSGDVRFGGNLNGAYIDSPCDFFRIVGSDFRDNVGTNLVNNAGTSATKVVGNNIS